MAAFTGTLNTNEFYGGLFNAYKLITTFADGLDGLDNTLASKFKMDGGAYRDKSVWTAMDILTSRVWDPSDTNVLATEQKVVPVQQEIVVDQKRQIALTTDQYLSKRAWMEPSAFESFNTVVQSQVGNTKKVYEQRLVDVATGTMEAAMPSGKGAGQSQTVLIGGTDPEDLRVRKIGKKIANIMVGVKDTTRDYNDYGFMQSYSKDAMMIVWNADYLNEFNYVDLPVIYHKEGIIDFVGDQLPGKYFGHTITATNISSYSASTPAAGKPIDSDDNTYVPGSNHANGCIRSKVEKTVTVSSVDYHVFPGDEIPAGATIVATTGDFVPGEVYIEDAKIICKIMHNDSIKFLTSFETSTEFFNAKNLSSNRYLTWMYAYPDYLRNYPLITLSEVNS